MPAVAKTSDDEIVAAARSIIAEHGAEALSFAAVASEVGVRGPSLYKRFADRAALLDAVRENVLRDLATALLGASRHREPVKQVSAMARAYRRFGNAEPHLYRLVMTTGGAPTEAARAAISPLFEALGRVVPAKSILPAARSLTAFLHGFVSMEINGSFQLGGSVDDAFDFGLGAILAGIRADRG